MSHFQSALITATLLATAGQAHSEDPRFGVEVLLGFPSADLKRVTEKEGLGMAFTLDWPSAGPHVLRPRLEFLFYPEETSTSSFTLNTPNGPFQYSDVVKRSVDHAGLGLDYLFYPAGRSAGWHLDAGAVLLRYTFKGRVTETASGGGSSYTETFSADETRTRGGFMLGFGYDFARNWRAGLRFTSTEIENTRLNAYTLSVGYRF